MDGIDRALECSAWKREGRKNRCQRTLRSRKEKDVKRRKTTKEKERKVECRKEKRPSSRKEEATRYLCHKGTGRAKKRGDHKPAWVGIEKKGNGGGGNHHGKGKGETHLTCSEIIPLRKKTGTR